MMIPIPHMARVRKAGRVVESSDMLELSVDGGVLVMTGPDEKIRVHRALCQDAEETVS